MSCLLSKGRLLPCKDGVAGVYKIWFLNYGTATPVFSGSTITNFSGTTTLYEYELKGQSKLDEDMVSSRDNSTTIVNQTLTLDLAGASSAAQNDEIKLMAYGRPSILVQNNDGSVIFAGRLRGMDLTSSVKTTGIALGDKVGYTITMVGTENEYANYVNGATITDPWASMTVKPTIIKGT